MRSPRGGTECPKTLQARKYEKNTKKLQIPHSGLGPKNTEKTPKNYENGHFLTLFVIFGIFSLCFRGPARNGGFCSFFVFFFVVPGLCATPGKSQVWKLWVLDQSLGQGFPMPKNGQTELTPQLPCGPVFFPRGPPTIPSDTKLLRK